MEERRNSRAGQPVSPRGRKNAQKSPRKNTRGLASIEDILRRWLKKTRASRRAGEHAIFGRWKEIVGEAIAARTRVVDVVGGELIVEVSSAPLLEELSTYYRKEILESLHGIEELRGIQTLRFRAGSTSSGP